ncbi:protein of unknown function [Trichlorobacter ammonificans]|uniref:Uncharacterized protein n=1 Tax=Trichlorobacter ammonificans TaxID=2916410 RepID=A0ABN8HH63_9BACT|nr:protein of unknown function [Trichlorobacter ammonificans]
MRIRRNRNINIQMPRLIPGSPLSALVEFVVQTRLYSVSGCSTLLEKAGASAARLLKPNKHHILRSHT